LIERAAYQERPVRYAYTLSDKGKALGDILLAYVRWGKKHLPGTQTLRELTVDSAKRNARRGAD
jgi:DNA-binding HxlR family transcriptional regulator